MNDCLFCKIINKEIPGYFVLEEKEYIAILDIFGASDGHSLVIPKKHGYSILDYSEEELGRVMGGVQKMAKKLQNVLKTDSITIGINHFEAEGVPHLHIHLIPRYKNDGGRVIQSLTEVGVKEDLNKTLEKLKKI